MASQYTAQRGTTILLLRTTVNRQRRWLPNVKEDVVVIAADQRHTSPPNLDPSDWSHYFANRVVEDSRRLEMATSAECDTIADQLIEQRRVERVKIALAGHLQRSDRTAWYEAKVDKCAYGDTYISRMGNMDISKALQNAIDERFSTPITGPFQPRSQDHWTTIFDDARASHSSTVTARNPPLRLPCLYGAIVVRKYEKTGWIRKKLKVDAAFGVDVVGLDQDLQNELDRLYAEQKMKRILDISSKTFAAFGSGGQFAEEYFVSNKPADGFRDMKHLRQFLRGIYDHVKEKDGSTSPTFRAFVLTRNGVCFPELSEDEQNRGELQMRD